MSYHIIAFFGGFILDLLMGDPCFLPHPVRLIGKLISETEKRLRGSQPAETGDGDGMCGSRSCRNRCGRLFMRSVPNASFGGRAFGVSDDIPDSGREMPESGKYESVSIFKRG